MTGRDGHIVSRFSWNTSFDTREKAAELQNRLSSWSRLAMPGEVAGVFDDLCPPGQTWHIRSLQIDLGKIDYDDLESELSKRLRKQLLEQLTDLVLYQDNKEDHIEILDQNTSDIRLIRHFLEHGYIPWYHKAPDQAINPLLAHQLKTNRREVMTMLREIGATQQNVLRRIAWQVHEANIIEVVKGLEPNDHAQVIDLSNEMTKLQQRESIVQGSLSDFRKNLWYWILSYLVTERGTIFNKIAFIKSNIKQMAAHYHIDYEKLIDIIARVVDNVAHHYTVNAEIIVTLKTLVAESRRDQDMDPHPKGKTDLLDPLKEHLDRLQGPLNKIGMAELNDLVTGLAAENRLRFREMINRAASDEGALSAFVQKLNGPSLRALFSALSDDGDTLSEIISLLAGVLKKQRIAASKNFLWEAGLEFLLARRSGFAIGELLVWLTDKVSSKMQVDKVKLLEDILTAGTFRRYKSVVNLDIYTALRSVIVSELSSGDTSVKGKKFSDLLHQLNDLLRTVNDKELFLSLKKVLAQYVLSKPREALAALQSYPAMQDLEQSLPYVLDHRSTDLLLKNAGRDADGPLMIARKIINIFGNDQDLQELISWIRNNMAQYAVQVMIFEPSAKTGSFTELFWKRIADGVPASLSAKFGLLTARAVAYHAAGPASLPGGFVQGTSKAMRSGVRLPVADHMALLISKPAKQAELSRLLSERFTERQFALLRQGDGQKAAAIMEYLAPGSKRLMDELIKEHEELMHLAWPNTSPTRIRSVLKELFWQCIVNYGHHRARAEALIRSFESAVGYRSRSAVRKANDSGHIVQIRPGSKSVRLTGGERLSGDEVLSLLEECFDLGRAVVTRNSVKYHLNDLLLTLTGTDAESTLRFIKSNPLTVSAVAVLNANMSFEHFSLLIANTATRRTYQAVSTLRSLYQLTVGIAVEALPNRLAIMYWQQLWSVIKAGELPAAELKRLLRDSLRWLANEVDAGPEQIITAIRERHYQLTPALYTALVDLTSASVLLPGATNVPVSRRLAQLRQRGMLQDITYYMVTLGQVPLWFGGASKGTAADLLNEIVVHHPINLMLVLKQNTITGQQMIWLSQTIDFRALVRSVGELARAQRSTLDDLAVLYEALKKITIAGISAAEMQRIVFRKLIKAWTNNNWKIISAENIWNELAWNLSVEYGIRREQLTDAVEKSGAYVPAALRVSFKYLKGQDMRNRAYPADKTMPLVLKKATIQKTQLAAVAKEGIPVKNAGLVMINNYVAMLFERLGIIQNQAFAGPAANDRAVHYLQYVVTGLTRTEEHLLPLNKLLCGLPLAHPVPDGIEIPEEQQKLIEGLISAMISHWSAIGDSSVNGFRGNWLVRDGLLTEFDERWELKVEKRAYDILLQQSPFSFSIIKYPWMDKPLHVNWPY